MAVTEPESRDGLAGWRWAGLITGLVAGGAVGGSGTLGRGFLLGAPVFGLCVLAGVLAGETSVRPPHSTTRTAVLEVRRIRDYLPRRLATAVGIAAVALLALLAATTITGSSDDLGRPGRVLLTMCSTGLQETRGPWVGSFYSGPLAAVVAAGLIAAGINLRVVVRRPRAGASPSAVTADDARRWHAARTVTGACGILVTFPLAGACLTTSAALLSFSCRPAWWTAAGWALLALLPVIMILMIWCAASLLAPRPTVSGGLSTAR